MSEISRRIGILAGIATPPVVESGTQLSERITGSTITEITEIVLTNAGDMVATKELLELFFVYSLLGLAGALGAYIFTNALVPLWKKLCKKIGCWFRGRKDRANKTRK